MFATFCAITSTLWFGLTLAVHVSKWVSDRVLPFDAFALIPSWSFFAPNPAVFDPYFIYRDKYLDGTYGTFQLVPICVPLRGFTAFLWHPDRRIYKAFFDLMSELQSLSIRLSPHEFKLSVPYLMLANYISTLPAADSVVARQFAIALNTGFDDAIQPTLVFVSEFHSL